MVEAHVFIILQFSVFICFCKCDFDIERYIYGLDQTPAGVITFTIVPMYHHCLYTGI